MRRLGEIFVLIAVIWLGTTLELHNRLRAKSPFPTRVTNTIQFMQLLAVIPAIVGLVLFLLSFK
jgi:hypothetical protein